MNAFDVGEQCAVLSNSGDRYREMLHLPSTSAGVYHLSAHSLDPKGPHIEDELHYVIEDLTVLVVFSPAEHSNTRSGSRSLQATRWGVPLQLVRRSYACPHGST